MGKNSPQLFLVLGSRLDMILVCLSFEERLQIKSLIASADLTFL